MQRANAITLIQKIGGAIHLFRPELALAAGICVLLGEAVALGTAPPFPVLVLGFVCGFFLSGSALITNDYFDLEVDRINAPQRPLPAGILTTSEVMALGMFAALIGLAAALAINLVALSLSLLIWVMGFLYNWKLKASGLWGNLIVCTAVAATFILGGIGVGQVWNPTLWAFSLMVFFFDLAEEIAGDAMDAEGDMQRGSQSIAIVYGKKAALWLSGVLFAVVIGLSFMLIASSGGIGYRLIIPLMDLVIAYFMFRLFRSRTIEEGRWSMRALYLSGSVGLMAFLVSLFLD
jgi:geranylgeranylglycerol-phosphate geranylgeranyltransferase